MATRRLDLGIIGGGWSAAFAAWLAADGGARVLRLLPRLDPEGLPRPLPPLDDARWRSLLASLGPEWTEPGAWRCFGGRVPDAISSRRIADDEHRESATVAHGRLECSVVDREWAWIEPSAGWAALRAALEKHLRAHEHIETQALPMDWRFARGLFRRTVVPQIDARPRHWLAFFAPADATVVCGSPVIARHLPRAGSDGPRSWWSDSHLTTAWFDGAAPPELQARGAVLAGATRPWGVVSGRGATVVSGGNPSGEPPRLWWGRLCATVAGALGGRWQSGRSGVS